MYIIVMAGGSGTRFWPLSRKARPKQLIPFVTERSMLAETLLRLSPLAPPERTIVVTAEHLVDAVCDLAPALPRANVLAEPVGRNTAPCIGLATHLIAQRAGEEDPVIGVFAADHHVRDTRAFCGDVERAAAAARGRDRIITLGITPTRPETGYGYIKVGGVGSGGEPAAVERFVEKPDRDTAQSYLESGDYLWNAGIFVFRASVMLGEIARQLPELGAGLDAIAPHLDTDVQDAQLRALFPALPSVSIDYGVMEAAAAVGVVPTDCGWSDLGHWGALHDVLPQDDAGNITRGDLVILHDTRGSVALNNRPDHVLAAVGLEDIVIVATKDATLVLPRDRSNEVRAILDRLEPDYK